MSKYWKLETEISKYSKLKHLKIEMYENWKLKCLKTKN